MKLGAGDYGQATRERRRTRRAAQLALAALGILAAGALAWVLLQGHSPSSRPGTSAQTAGTGRPCPGARSCPYTAAAIVGQSDRGLLRIPEALAVAPHGQVYVGDQFSYAVRRFSPRGRLEAEWGSYGAGPGQFGAIGGLAVGAEGDVYVVDSTHDRIERFTSGGRLLDMWGSKGSGLGQFYLGSGPTPDRPPGGAIAVSGGYVYVADSSNDRIERFDLNGSHPVVLIRGGNDPGQLNEPRGLTVADGELYVADDSNRRVEVFNLDGRLLRSVGSFGTGPLQFADPFGVAVDGADVYVADDNNNRIVELTRDLTHVRTFVGGAGSDRLGYVRALAVGAHGELFVTSSSANRIFVFSPQGHLLSTWGQPPRFISPLAVTTTPTGSAYVVETFGSQSPITLLDSSLAYRGAWEAGGEAIIGSHWFSPSGAAPGTGGSLWVTDTENDLIRHFNAEGAFLGAIDPHHGGDDPLALPADVASGPEGKLYVADSSANRIEIFSSSGAFERAFGGAGADQPHLLDPQALTVDAHGDVYVADTGADRVLVLGPSGHPLDEWGRPGRAPGELEEPSGIAVDVDGHVFVSDTGGDRIGEFTTAGRPLAEWGVDGRGLGEFDEPRGLAIDCDGKLLVADTRNNRVQAFSGAAVPRGCDSG
jgi:tripartite motif-containing protein 71